MMAGDTAMRITAAAKDETRRRILKVAQTQFAQQGFEQTTTRDIARDANIAVGTLFNYFPTKESIVENLVNEGCMRAAERFAAELERNGQKDSATLEEELFAHVAIVLRELKPYRKYLPALLETSLSPLATDHSGDQISFRAAHLEIVGQILLRHAPQDAVSPIAIQLYWTLYTGVLVFWACDSSPRQEDSLALLDESLAMFVGWLTDSKISDPAVRPAERTSKNER
jgi:AcrR family transcriptional regulator